MPYPSRWAPAGWLRLSLAILLGRLAFPASPGPVGLTVDGQGRILHEGKPFRGIGVNYFDLFSRSLSSADSTPVLRHLDLFSQHGVPFVRFMGGGYWPSEFGLWQTNRAQFLDRFDRVVRAAEQARMGLVPSFCWPVATVPDLVGEPVSAWGNPGSRTHAWMREYVGELVRRTRGSTAIWAWEFGNEYNLPADLPNAAEHRPPVVPSLGTPDRRSAADELTHGQIRVAIREFAREIRRHDPHRLILSGNAFPRKSAWHQMTQRTWETDAPEQWREMLRNDNPDPVNSLTGRLYSEDDRLRLPWAAVAAAETRKPLFVGEFGVPGADTPANRARFNGLLEDLERHRVALAALWVFDFAGQAGEWSVTFDNDRAWQLDEIARVNQRWRRVEGNP